MGSPQPNTVLHVITRLVMGGAARVVLDQCRLLHGAGWTVHLAAGPQTGSEGSFWPEAEALEQSGVLTLHRIPNLVREVAPHRDAMALASLQRLIRRIRPAVVHAHTSKAGLIGCTAARLFTGAVPLLTPHGHIFNRNAQIPGLGAKGTKRWLLEKLAAQSVAQARLVTCPNQTELDEGVNLGAWPRSMAVVVPNGVDTSHFRPGDRASARAASNLPTDARIIGVVARLTTEKGVDLAIQALSLLPGFRLAICGDGPERESLEALVRELNLAGRVHWLGKVADMAALYPAFDLLMVPSRTEAHGLVAAEAMACGIPVVAARVGGLQSVVRERITGTFAVPDDPKSLAAGAEWVAAQPPGTFSVCREWVESEWSHQAMLRGLLGVYASLTRRPAAAAPQSSSP